MLCPARASRIAPALPYARRGRPSGCCALSELIEQLHLLDHRRRPASSLVSTNLSANRESMRLAPPALLSTPTRATAPAVDWWATIPSETPRCSLAGSRAALRTARVVGLHLATGARRAPWLLIGLGLALALVCTAGSLLGPLSAPLLEAWIPPDTWRQVDHTEYGAAWGSQRLEQIIVRPRVADGWTSVPKTADGGSAAEHKALKAARKSSLRAALSLLLHLEQGLVVSVDGQPVRYNDVCYQPGEPYAAGCLTFTPSAWWTPHESSISIGAGSKGLEAGTVPPPSAQSILDQFDHDPDPWKTIAEQPTAQGPVTGLQIERRQVMGGVSGNSTTAMSTRVEALMIWLFVDVAPAKVSNATYLRKVNDWEQALLTAAESAGKNESSSIRVFRKIDGSVQSEIQLAAQADVILVYVTVAALIAAHLAVVTADALHYGRRRSQWRLGMIGGMVLGLTLGAQFGITQWLVHLGLLVGYPSQAMMLFLPLTTGLHQRCLLVGQCRFCLAGPKPATLPESLAMNVLAPGFCTMLVSASPLLLAPIVGIVTTPAVIGCCVVGGLGALLDWLLLATVYLPAVVLWLQAREKAALHGRQVVWQVPGRGPIAAVSPAHERAADLLRRAKDRAVNHRQLLVTGDGGGDLCGRLTAADSSLQQPFLPPASTAITSSNISNRLPEQLNDHIPSTAEASSGSLGTGNDLGNGHACWHTVDCVFRIMMVAGATMLLGFCLQYWFVQHGRPPVVSTQQLVGPNSYIKKWQDQYDLFFKQLPLPLDFALTGTGGGAESGKVAPNEGTILTDPLNGPALAAAAAKLRADPRLDPTKVRDWYGKFRSWCYSLQKLCRNTMEPVPHVGAIVKPSAPDSKIAMISSNFIGGCCGDLYPTSRSFDRYLGTFILEHPNFAADIQLKGPLPQKGALVSAKFGASTRAGATGSYDALRLLPSNMHTLALEALPPAATTAGLRMYCFSDAFPFFELWDPTRSDLLRAGALQLAAAFVLLLITLGWCPGLVVLLGCSAAISTTAVVMNAVFQADFNLITAVNTLICVPLTTDIYFHLGYRTTVVHTTSGVAHRKKALLTSVVLPASISFCASVGVPMLIMLLCQSPLNVLFGSLLLAMLAIQGVFMLVLLLPVLGFIGKDAYMAQLSLSMQRRSSDYLS